MLQANLYLLFITMIWGLTFPLIRNAMFNIDPNLFVAIRFLLASLLLLPFVLTKLKNTNKDIIISSLIMGLLNGVTYISQTTGLKTIPASRSAFITGLSVILVPLFAPFFKLGSLKIIDLICSVICVLGLYILTGADLKNINVGDQWTILCAISCSLQIVYLQYCIPRINNYEILTFYQLLFTAPLAVVFAPFANYHDLFYPNVLLALLFCAIFATIIAYLIQAKYQRYTTAAKAALIFALEPVFASFFGFFINGEIVTKYIIIGGILVLISLIIPSFIELVKKNSENTVKKRETIHEAN